MPDPQVLYVVTAVVVLALIAWVVAVLTRTADAVDASKSNPIPATAGGSPPPEAEIGPSSKTIPADPPIAEAEPKKSAPPAATESLSTASTEVRVDVEEEEEPTGPHALILVTAVGRTD